MTVIVFISRVKFPQAASLSMDKLVFVSVGLFAIIFNLATNGQQFKCFLDGRIEILIGRDKGYARAIAKYSLGICPTTFDDTYTKLIVTHCVFGEEITVVLSSRNATWDDTIYGGKRMLSFSVRCNPVNSSGLIGTALLHVTPELQMTRMSSIEPIMDKVRTALYKDYTLNTLATKVVIGSHIVWAIIVSYGRIYPVSCTAYEGTDVNVDKPNRIIIQDGCSVDEELVGDFNSSDPSKIIASFYAFRFLNSPYVTVVCDVRVCPAWSNECLFHCNGHKKKRYADLYHPVMHTENVRVSLLVEDRPSYSSTACGFTSPVSLSTMLILLSTFWFRAVC